MRRFIVFVSCAALLVVAVIAGLGLGSGSASLADLFSPSTRAHEVLVQVRLPRVLLAVVAGAGLASVGAAFQTVLRNPLAEPHLLGISGGAALGATLAIVLGLRGPGIFTAAGVPALAFGGGMAATAVILMSVRGGRTQGTSMLLAGVVVNFIASGAITLVESLAEPNQIQSLLWWLTGYLDVLSWAQLAVVAAYAALGLAVLFCDAGRMNLLALGDEPAASLGLDVRRLERRTFLACAVVVGAVVSATGLIGFVGLVVPQALRRVLGPDLRVLLPASALGGASLLVLCDLAVRVGARRLHTEIPVGAVTALIGGPVFLALLRRGPAA